MKWQIQTFESLPSTQAHLKQSAAAFPEGQVIAAQTQSQGYGRKGDLWQSELGGLYFSFLLKPALVLPHLPWVLLLSLSQWLRQVVSLDFFLKWPNDIWAEQGKLSGCLVDSQVLGTQPLYYICGVGLNLNQLNLQAPATSLKQLTRQDYSVDQALDEILAIFSVHYQQALLGQPAFESYFYQRLQALNLALPRENISIKENLNVCI